MATTELYLIRHGIAAERGPEWPDDAERPLIERGITRLREEAKGLAALGVDLDAVLTSPLVRARQTAEIISKGLPQNPRVITMESLSPGGSYARFMEELASHSKRSRVACVGHEPDLGALASRLIGAKRALEFKKGAVCCIELDAVPPTGLGALRWFATPRMLRRAAS